MSFILYLDELFQSPLCIIYFVHQFWPDCYDHVSKEGAGIDHRVTCPYFYSEWNASQYHICLSLQTAVSIVTYALFLFSIVKISATFHIIALIEIHWSIAIRPINAAIWNVYNRVLFICINYFQSADIFSA